MAFSGFCRLQIHVPAVKNNPILMIQSYPSSQKKPKYYLQRGAVPYPPGRFADRLGGLRTARVWSLDLIFFWSVCDLISDFLVFSDKFEFLHIFSGTHLDNSSLSCFHVLCPEIILSWLQSLIWTILLCLAFMFHVLELTCLHFNPWF